MSDELLHSLANITKKERSVIKKKALRKLALKAKVIDATFTHGIKERPLKDVIEGEAEKIVFYRITHKAFDPELFVGDLRIMMLNPDAKYDIWGTVGIGFMKTIGRLFLSKDYVNSFQRDKDFFCSEMMCIAAKKQDVSISKRIGKNSSPADIIRSRYTRMILPSLVRRGDLFFSVGKPGLFSKEAFFHWLIMMGCDSEFVHVGAISELD